MLCPIDQAAKVRSTAVENITSERSRGRMMYLACDEQWVGASRRDRQGSAAQPHFFNPAWVTVPFVREGSTIVIGCNSALDDVVQCLYDSVLLGGIQRSPTLGIAIHLR